MLGVSMLTQGIHFSTSLSMHIFAEYFANTVADQVAHRYARIEIYSSNNHRERAVTTTKSAEKSQKFRALAESRTNKAIEAIARIGNLSNRQIYEYEETEVRKIVRALRDAVSAVEARFASPRAKGGGGFKL